jgi:hypothetical protein
VNTEMVLHCKAITVGQDNFEYQKTVLPHMQSFLEIRFIFDFGLNSVLKVYQRFR